MNSRKSILSIGAAMFAGVLLDVSAVPAQAQSEVLRVNVPFSFYFGDQHLPPGEYIFTPLPNGLVKIADSENKPSVTLITFRVSNGKRANTAKVVFNQYGEDTFLSEMWWTGTHDGYRPMQSKRERELAKSSSPIRIAVVQR